jgi:hypothetical protein
MEFEERMRLKKKLENNLGDATLNEKHDAVTNWEIWCTMDTNSNLAKEGTVVVIKERGVSKPLSLFKKEGGAYGEIVEEKKVSDKEHDNIESEVRDMF